MFCLQFLVYYLCFGWCVFLNSNLTAQHLIVSSSSQSDSLKWENNCLKFSMHIFLSKRTHTHPKLSRSSSSQPFNFQNKQVERNCMRLCVYVRPLFEIRFKIFSMWQNAFQTIEQLTSDGVECVLNFKLAFEFDFFVLFENLKAHLGLLVSHTYPTK